MWDLGHELIFAAVEGKYVGKLIHVAGGHSLSCHFHAEKEGTICVVVQGECLVEHGTGVDQLQETRLGPGTPSTCRRG